MRTVDAFVPGEHRRMRSGVWAELVCLIGVGALMLWWSWGRWPDVLIDFGRELYVSWQLVEGRRLYAHLEYFNGPLSPYLNALWFRLFGVSLRTLVLCNLAILVGIVVLLRRIMILIGDRVSGTMTCLSFLTVFAFGQLVACGNYNFICPYSHELTHGFGLALLGLYGLWRYEQRPNTAVLVGLGVTLGLTFLTKAELFLATVLGVGSGVLLMQVVGRPVAGKQAGQVSILAAAVGLTVGIAFLVLAASVPPALALKGILGSWPYILGGEIFSHPFYRLWMGTDHIERSIRLMSLWSLRDALIVLPGVLASVCLPKLTGRRWLHPVVFGIGGVGSLLLALHWYVADFGGLGRALPVVMLGSALSWTARAWHVRDNVTACRLAIFRTAVCLFALGMLGKMLLFSRVYNYGFVLALPASMVAVVLLTAWLPAVIGRCGGDGRAFRVVGIALVAVTVSFHLRFVSHWFAQKTIRVGEGNDAFIADSRGRVVARALADWGRRIGHDETLAVLPMGTMLNYLLRRASPVRYVSFAPFDHRLYGTQALVSELARHPPDYIILADIDTGEDGARLFGRDYGHELSVWVANHYHAVSLIGHPPLHDAGFGLLLMERNHRERTGTVSEGSEGREEATRG